MSTPSEVTAASVCFRCIPTDMQLPVLIYLFNNLTGMSATPQELVTAAKCYSCIPTNMQVPTLLYLSETILSGGTIGGVSCGNVDPTDAPSNPDACRLYMNTAADALWYWNGTEWKALLQ